MDCPECGEAMVVFAVPADVRDVAPGEGTAAICPRCLSLVGADERDDAAPPDPDFSRIVESFPEGEAGAAMAVAVGLLVDSMVLNRETITRLMEAVSDGGADPWLVLERIAASPTVRPDADVGRARRQLELLDR